MLYIFDMDGTLTALLPNGKGRPRPPNMFAEQRLLPGVIPKIHELRDQGHTLALASNQGGVAFGYLTYTHAQNLITNVVEMLEFNDFEFCPHHPKGTDPRFGVPCICRKPQSGMLLKLMKRQCMSTADTVFIGDRPTDERAAKNAGVSFKWASDFFQKKEESE